MSMIEPNKIPQGQIVNVLLNPIKMDQPQVINLDKPNGNNIPVADPKNQGAVLQSRISLDVLPVQQGENKTEKSSFFQESQIWKEIEWLTMNNQYPEAIPLALQWLVSQNSVSQSDCIKVAGICLLGGEHKLYENIIDMMPYSKEPRIPSDAQKKLLTSFKTEVESKLKTKQEKERGQERTPNTKIGTELGANVIVPETSNSKKSEALQYVLNIETLVESNQSVPRINIIHAVSTLNLEGFNKEANGLIKFITNEYNVTTITKEDIKPILNALGK